jgi:alpha-galactosidase
MSDPKIAASRPPMGWNSWDCYGTTVTEDEVLANARFMAEHLLPYGWDTVVVDVQWHEPTARAGGYNDGAPLELDAHGRPRPAVTRFPSAADGRGFGPLAQQVHALGLRFGLHIMRGVPRLAVDRRLPVLGTGSTAADVADTASVCAWNPDNYGLNHDHPDAQAYYDSLAALFAGWGVDFVKADDMLWPYHQQEISALGRALRGCGRPIVLSLSPGRALSLEHLENLRESAELWRISDDLWDRWDDVEAQFGRLARWAPHAQPGAWPDADMLPLGRIGIRAERGADRHSLLTYEEQRTLMTLWCIGRSPLMFGGDLPTTRPDTIGLLTNEAVLAVLSHSAHNREVVRDGRLVVWTADATDRDARYIALFNLGDDAAELTLPLSDAGLASAREAVDLWTGKPFPIEDDEITAAVAPHGSLLLRVDEPDRSTR